MAEGSNDFSGEGNSESRRHIEAFRLNEVFEDETSDS